MTLVIASPNALSGDAQDAEDGRAGYHLLPELDHELSVCQAACQKAVELFVAAPEDGYLLAERLPRFGKLLIAPADAAYDQLPPGRKKSLLALGLFLLDSERFAGRLVGHIAYEGPDGFLGMMVSRLGDWRNVDEIEGDAADIVFDRACELMRADLGPSFASNPNKDNLVALLSVLAHSARSALMRAELEHLAGDKQLPAEVRRELDAM